MLSSPIARPVAARIDAPRVAARPFALAAPEDDEVTGLSGKSILVFDNSPDTVAMLQMWFELLGVRVHGASPSVSPAAVSDLVQQQAPDVIVFDVPLPYDTNARTLRALHDAGAFGDTPVVITTTNPRALALGSALRPSTAEPIEKPYDVEFLARRVIEAGAEGQRAKVKGQR